MSGEVPSPDIHWGAYDQLQRNAARSRNSLAGVTLNSPDDSGPVQKFQTEGHVGELRNAVARVENHGFSSLPLVGAKGIAIYLGGDRGNGIVVATVDARYRPTGLHPGEAQLYIVDGAQKDGTGGTTRTILQGLLGWVAKLFGKMILIGDSNTVNITLTGSGLIKLAGNVEITGNLTVDGKTTTVQNLSIQGTESGGGAA
jgi:phage baseplate assembly protein V